MRWASTEARNGLRSCVIGLTAIAAVLGFTSNVADARHHRRIHIHHARHGGHHVHHSRHAGDGYSPPSASIIVDGNSGRVLEDSNPDALRHPASLTKVMTLYLLFERLQAGKIALNTPLSVSAHAAAQAPTKLGLKPGQSISVEDAIKGIVTRSANDAAVVIAENLGGSEEAFAREMTEKAHALGMSRTRYVNASGLPDDDQVTTARDQALLGRAIQDRFPRYYKFFSTTSFVFRGNTIRGHNHLLGSVPGVDGIKTGFTRSSGFNLITSLHRDGRYLIGVVLGGHSAFERDARMRRLLENNFDVASTRRNAPAVADNPEQRPEAPAVAVAHEPMRLHADPTPTVTASVTAPPAGKSRAHPGSTDPIKPIMVKTITYRAVIVHPGAMTPMPVLVPVVPSPARGTKPEAERQVASAELPHAAPAAAEPAGAVATGKHAAVAAPAAAASHTVVAEAPAAATEQGKSAPAHEAARPHPHSGWMIQIGAFDGENEARQHLSEAQSKLHALLGSADAFTERVQKGDKELYRARFAGFDKSAAEAACRQLRRNEFACLTLKD